MSTRRRTEFVSLASHELRTPISVVHGVAATLHHRGDALDHDQLRGLRRLLFEQTTRLAELTEQLLDLSRLDAGAVRLRTERFSPRERCETLLPRLAPDRAADVRIEIDPAVEIVSDPNAFERVVSNLVVNALRYGSPPVFLRGQAPTRFGSRSRIGGAASTRASCRSSSIGSPGATTTVEPASPGQASVSRSRPPSRRRSAASLGYETPAPGGARFVLRLPLGDR